VFLQQRHAAEGARADAALVLLHLGVGLQVSPQVGAVGKGPVAVGAGERALTWKRGKGGREEEKNHTSYNLTLHISQGPPINTSHTHTHTHTF